SFSRRFEHLRLRAIATLISLLIRKRYSQQPALRRRNPQYLARGIPFSTSATPITAHSATSGWPASTSSICLAAAAVEPGAGKPAEERRPAGIEHPVPAPLPVDRLGSFRPKLLGPLKRPV